MQEKKYYIQTFGCQANIRDSQTMAGTLDALGFLPTSDFKDADVLIINTCSVRQKSEDKVYGWGLVLGNGLEAVNVLYDKKNTQKIFITGCMVGSAKGDRVRHKEQILKDKMPWAHYFLAPDEEHLIPKILVEEKIADGWALAALDKNFINPAFGNQTEWAYVNISTGCDNFCTFCVVPYARGEEKHRSEADILHEINHLINRGFKNIMLVGQNVNSWGLDRTEKFKIRSGSDQKLPFADLLRKVHSIDGVEKINFISSNPFDFTTDLIDALKLPKIDRYLHIAVQSGDNEVLKRMNRRHTIEDFRNLIDKIKSEIPDMEIGTDIIVGFPGETDEQFLNTVKLFDPKQDGINFKNAYISIYSPRIGTNAAKFFNDDVPLKEKKRRHKVLSEVWKQGQQF